MQLVRLLVRFKVAQLSGTPVLGMMHAARCTRALTRRRRCAGIGAATVPLAAYASGQALPPSATAGIAALVVGACRARRARAQLTWN